MEMVMVVDYLPSERGTVVSIVIFDCQTLAR